MNGMVILTADKPAIARAFAALKNLEMESYQRAIDRGDLQSAACVLGDLADIFELTDYLLKDNGPDFVKKLSFMDTAPREYATEAFEREGIIR